MNKQSALEIINKKINKEYATRTAAAKALGVARNNLQLALDDRLAEIPQYLLEFAGMEAITPVTTYRKKSGE